MMILTTMAIMRSRGMLSLKEDSGLKIGQVFCVNHNSLKIRYY